MIKNQSIYHYNVITINGSQVSVTVKSLAGAVIDQYTLGAPVPDGGVGPADGGAPPDLATDSVGAADVALDLNALTDTNGADTWGAEVWELLRSLEAAASGGSLRPPHFLGGEWGAGGSAQGFEFRSHAGHAPSAQVCGRKNPP